MSPTARDGLLSLGAALGIVLTARSLKSGTCRGRGGHAAHRRSVAECPADDGRAAGRCARGPRRGIDERRGRLGSHRAARHRGVPPAAAQRGAAFAAVFAPFQLSLLPRDPELIASLRAAIGTPPARPRRQALPTGSPTIIPSNAIAAAAQGAMLPLVVFALFFGFALTRVEARRAPPARSVPDARRRHDRHRALGVVGGAAGRVRAGSSSARASAGVC